MEAAMEEYTEGVAANADSDSATKERAVRCEQEIKKSFKTHGIDTEEAQLVEASRFATAMISPNLRENKVAFTKLAELMRVMTVGVMLCILAATVLHLEANVLHVEAPVLHLEMPVFHLQTPVCFFI